MASPFDKRAIEKVRYDEALLPYVAPAPFDIYLRPHAESDALFDRLVIVSGTPGSGKTTMAHLFRLPTLRKLQEMAETSPQLGDLRDALANCKAYESKFPRIAGCRLSMEEAYRDCWECPYEPAIRNRLLRSLINARAMLSWLQGFIDAKIMLEDVRLVGRRGTPGELDSVGGTSASEAMEHAIAVERAVIRVCGALLPPPIEQFPPELNDAYAPIDLLDRFTAPVDERQCEILPLLVLDDLQHLHVEQQKYLIRWLAGREVRIARWMLTRFDSFGPEQILYGKPMAQGLTDAAEPGVQLGRDVQEIRLQSERSKSRTEFRKVAVQLCKRYLAQIPVMQTRGATDIRQMLEERLESITKAQQAAAETLMEQVIKNTHLPAPWVVGIKQQVAEFLEERAVRGVEAETVGRAMTAILVARQGKKVRQGSIFEDNGDSEIEEHVVRPNPGVVHGARIHLWHRAELPYLYGFDDLADLANENTERFLDFAGQLVNLLMTRVIRSAEARLSPQQQFSSLRAHAQLMVAGWNFPEADLVRQLASGIAGECVTRSLEPNASLGGGASAYGIPMSEFTRITQDQPDLARVLQFGVAYNVFSLVPEQRSKNKDWCLIELAGPVLIANGLTLQRGGFLERTVADVLKYVQREEEGHA
ncbi:hypothetical protein XarbCFBP8132_11870 [Xanthomonas arboricola]|uniref:hypothetical protein n=1 Tax=Xanthomonas arboricola TaxID=56448 RepID=UPI000CEE7A53|nr:hypothetical protein [Xanthomonas arboricola]PPT41767.1 hypothetical protein XarbCFBP8132_11870 [Xanthomonas arboricola]